jgi:uncharacterized small protein (DUF1192 family)
MSLFDEDGAKRKIAHEIGADLSLLSADELTARIGLLREEISRLESEREAKQKGRAAAENLFKSR